MRLVTLYAAAFLCASAWGVLASLVGLDGLAFGSVVFVLAVVAAVLCASAVEHTPGNATGRTRHAAGSQDATRDGARGDDC